MRMEQVRVCQRHLQQHFNDVADGAIIWQSDLLCSADEVPQAEHRKVFKNATAAMTALPDKKTTIHFPAVHPTLPMGSFSKPDPC